MIHWIVLIPFIFNISSCGKKAEEIPTDQILARIDDRILTVDEFLQRAEYTIRPDYCSMDNYIHKKIVLNSLIGEKLLALETNEETPLLKNEGFLAYIRGRKEQAMRQVLYEQDAYNQVELDSAEIRTAFNVAGRVYNVSYFSLSDREKVKAVADSLESDKWTFNELYREIWGGEEPAARQVRWEEKNHPAIERVLFMSAPEKDQVVGPVQVDEENYIFMQINGWTDSRVITEQTMRQRLFDVKEKLTRNHAAHIWSDRVQDIMKDKHLEFSEEIFWKMNEIFFNRYYITDKEKKDTFNRKFWQGKDVELTIEDFEDEAKILNDPFFTIEGTIWTVKEFKELLASHPLVFRDRKIPAEEFPKQFKLAVVDLIRDKYITDVAYEKKLDQHQSVQIITKMWEDALLAYYNKLQYLDRITEGNKVDVASEGQVKRYMNPYIDSLQIKYTDRIEINMDAFEKIRLTHIDMYVTQRQMPYQTVVPSFPTVTTDNRLDYGRLMEK